MTPAEIQAAFTAQLEFNRQIQQQAATADGRLSRIEQQTSENSQSIAALGQNIQAISRDVAQLVATQQQTRDYVQSAVEDVVSMVGTLAEGQQQVQIAVTRIDQAIEELRAANQRQERINDFLLREQGLNGG
jgi:ABC-type transporter Mla subunit MlaD